MTLISRSLIRKIVLLLAPIAAIFMTSSGLAQKKQGETRTAITWEHSDDGLKRRLEIRGKAEFNDDYTDIKDVSEGGVVRIEEVRNGQSRRYPALSGVFFQTVGTIDSDYEHRRVLSALLKTKSLSEQALTQLLDSAAAISSDYEKATLLLEASSAYTGDARLRSAFLKAVETINSDYERGRVLSALLKNKQIG